MDGSRAPGLARAACGAGFRLRVEHIDDPNLGSYQRTIGYVVCSDLPFGMVDPCDGAEPHLTW